MGRLDLPDDEVERLLRRLTDVVLKRAAALRKRFNEDPHDDSYSAQSCAPISPVGINQGWCALWAILARRLVGGDLLATEYHVFLMRCGYAHDAECPEGVSPWMELPYYGGVVWGDDPADPVTIECAYEGWGCNIPFARPPFHWLKEIR